MDGAFSFIEYKFVGPSHNNCDCLHCWVGPCDLGGGGGEEEQGTWTVRRVGEREGKGEREKEREGEGEGGRERKKRKEGKERSK